MHTVDLLAIAWKEVPGDLAPLDPRAYWSLPGLAGHAARFPPEQVRELREHVRLMPQEELPKPSARPPWVFRQSEHGPGGVLLRLFANRNRGLYAAYAIMAVTGRGLSPSTVLMAGYGRKQLSPEEFADYISVLDIDAADLSVVTGVDLLAPLPQRPPGTAGWHG